MSYIKSPLNIEDKSFEIISEIIAEMRPEYVFRNELEAKIIKRAIHTSADFDWLDILKFSPTAIDELLQGLQQGATIYTDTNMVLAGMNKRRLDELGCDYHCYVADPEVIARAKRSGVTRSMEALHIAAENSGLKIFVFGNAPTALFYLLELVQEQKIDNICAVVGVPVGFVGAAESKEALLQSSLPFITAQGRKGGSNIAAAIINALLYSMNDVRV